MSAYDDPAAAASDWHLVVPVKGGSGAKSRLHPPPGIARSALAGAFAADTLAAVVAALPAGQVVVVTSARDMGDLAEALGATVVPDPGRGLGPAVQAGLGHLRQAGWTGPVGVLLGDLPALRAEDLAEALAFAAGHPAAFVPDADGTGTVLLTGTSLDALNPSFGAGSAARHALSHLRLDLRLPRLRTDVDDDDSLRAAVRLGVGPATTEVLHAAESAG